MIDLYQGFCILIKFKKNLSIKNFQILLNGILNIQRCCTKNLLLLKQMDNWCNKIIRFENIYEDFKDVTNASI